MKLFRTVIYTAVASVALLMGGCKKKSDTVSTLPYLTGTPAFSIPGYAYRKQEFTLTPNAVTNPTGDVGYYWKLSWESVNDTTKTEGASGDGSISFAVPDAIGEYTVSCVAFADGYYTASSKATVYVVDTELGTTITGLGISRTDARFTDGRDGATYYFSTVAGKDWMRQNLYYSGSGESYSDAPAMDPLFGRFYSWEEAVEACPEGWHLPGDAEWKELASVVGGDNVEDSVMSFRGIAGELMADAKFLGSKMWEFWPQVKITNSTGLCVIPTGYGVNSGTTKFSGLEEYAAFWTADSQGSDGVYRYFYVTSSDVMRGLGDKSSFRASIRCVR